MRLVYATKIIWFNFIPELKKSLNTPMEVQDLVAKLFPAGCGQLRPCPLLARRRTQPTQGQEGGECTGEGERYLHVVSARAAVTAV